MVRQQTTQFWTTLKNALEPIQSLVTILAIIIGGSWTYMLFVKERALYPHAKIEHALSHIALSKDSNLLLVSMTIRNTGTSLLYIKKMLIRIQQVLPALPCADRRPCAAEQIDKALRRVNRQEDRFTWPLISERIPNWDTPIELEPTEEDCIDFEFAIPSSITNVRVYSYIRNEAKIQRREIGWSLGSYYSFGSKKGEKL